LSKKKFKKKVSNCFLSFKIFKFLSLRNFVAGIWVEGIWREVGKRCQGKQGSGIEWSGKCKVESTQSA
jgi:hypothetical protein